MTDNTPHNLAFEYLPGEIYVGFTQSDQLFLKVDSKTKSGNIRFLVLRTVFGEWLNTCGWSEATIRPNTTDPGYILIARRGKLNGWQVKIDGLHYSIQEKYDPEYPYKVTRYY